jgi:diadenylate cyclase
MEGLIASFREVAAQFRLSDAVDILAVALLLYFALSRLKGTRALQMVFGLVVLGVAYLAAQAWQMNTLGWLLESFFASIVIVTVVLFQNEIRRALALVGSNPLTGSEVRQREHLLEELVGAVAALSAKRIGALIVLEQGNSLKAYVEKGLPLQAVPSRELILSIFMPFSPIHDGAVVVSGGLVAAARCFLPLASNPRLEKVLGTRHRAALGLTEETDAVVIVVSEETGRISVAHEGRLSQHLDADALRALLLGMMPGGALGRRRGWKERLGLARHAG